MQLVLGSNFNKCVCCFVLSECVVSPPLWVVKVKVSKQDVFLVQYKERGNLAEGSLLLAARATRRVVAVVDREQFLGGGLQLDGDKVPC